ncbi:MAG TPA: IS1634 family transposase [Syntrophorhabdales bacterium]|nr:IS1634 family transposase [Syntrophorhabdales bacterium]
MYIDVVPNRNSRPAVLLREAWREGKKVKRRTVANLTDWPEEKVEALRRVLKGETVVAPKEAFHIERSLAHGHVEAVLGTIRRIGLDTVIASRRSRERDLVIAMLAERLLHPSSKLATARLMHTTTLAEELGVGDADEDDLYRAMDWLLSRQETIEKKLAAKHLAEGAPVLYDVTSSYYEGRTCPLALFGHDRDKEKGKPIIVYGVVTDHEGLPVAVSVYPGNTGDPTTVPDQVETLKGRFGLNRLVLVGDRGMLTTTQLETLKSHPGIGWISALRSRAIRNLVEGGALQLSLFDQTDLAEIASDDYPGERLIACFNPLLAEERKRKREELLAATERELERIERQVARRTRTPLDKAEIGKKVGGVLKRFKVGKHFKVTIGEGTFSFARNEQSIQREEALDGIYVIRTSEPEETLSPEDAVRTYKNLAHVERAFRSLKGLDLLIRSIWHRTEAHVKAHIFLCLLAYYVEWHMRRALAPLLFDDEELPEKRKTRHAVRPAKASPSALRKKRTGMTPDGLPVQSFSTLLAELATRCRHRVRIGTDPAQPSFSRVTELTPLQARAFELLRL